MFTKAGIRLLHQETHTCLAMLIAQASSLPLGLFTQQVAGFGRATVQAQLVHIFSVETSWVLGLQNLPTAPLPGADYATPQAVTELQRETASHTLAYLQQVDEQELNAVLPHRPERWVGPLRSPGFILHHVMTHAFHHKGQVAALFRLLGHPAPDTDLQR